MHITQEHDSCTLQTKQFGSCCLYILELSLSMNISDCCLSIFEDEQPPEMMDGQQCWLGSCARVSRISCGYSGSDSARVGHQSTLLSLGRRMEPSCIAEPFARWMCNSSDRSQGRAIIQILEESMASPASGKSNKTIWLFRAQQDSGLCVYTHQLPVLPNNSSCYRKPS